MIFTDELGERWEVLASTPWMKGKWYLTDYGLIEAQSDGVDGTKTYLQVRPVPVEHKYGGVVFEETGQERVPVAGEWFVWGKGPCFAFPGLSLVIPQAILRPVRLEPEATTPPERMGKA